MTSNEGEVRRLRDTSDLDRVLNAIRSKLLGRYPRVARELRYVELPEHEQRFFPRMHESEVGALAVPPLEGYVEVDSFRWNEFFATNDVLVYRLLKRVYGPPDPAAIFVAVADGKAYPYDWSFTVRVAPALAVEVRRVSHSILLFSWGRAGATEQEKSQAADAVKSFTDDFLESINKSRALFDSVRDLESTSKTLNVAIRNPYVEKYSAGQDLLNLGEAYDRPHEWKRHRKDEKVKASSTGSLYLGAIMYFYVALEAFENLVLAKCGKPDISPKDHKRYAHMRLEERFAELHTRCNGFSRSPIPFGSELQRRLRPLRKVRNQVLHGNLVKELNLYSLEEDGYLFMYDPESDEPEGARSKEYLPLNRHSVRRKHALYVKELVDQVAEAVADAAMEETKAILAQIRNAPILMPSE